MLESDVEWTVVRRAEHKGWFTRKLRWIGRRHAPDHLFAKAGTLIFVEFKRPKNPSDRVMQDREHERMREAGIEVRKVYTIEEGDALFGF